jgi:hypothetical protein
MQPQAGVMHLVSRTERPTRGRLAQGSIVARKEKTNCASQVKYRRSPPSPCPPNAFTLIRENNTQTRTCSSVQPPRPLDRNAICHTHLSQGTSICVQALHTVTPHGSPQHAAISRTHNRLTTNHVPAAAAAVARPVSTSLTPTVMHCCSSCCVCCRQLNMCARLHQLQENKHMRWLCPVHCCRPAVPPVSFPCVTGAPECGFTALLQVLIAGH